MSLKLIGAVLIIVGCGGFGFMIASAHRKEERGLRQLMGALDFMECELQYRSTALPELCRQTAAECGGSLGRVFLNIAAELEDQISPDVQRCMKAALSNTKDIPKLTLEALQMLGSSLGRFDMEGQLKGLEGVRKECRRYLEKITGDKDVRLRSYQTLWLCAGAAIVIIFM